MLRILAAATTAALVLLLPAGDTADAHRNNHRGDRLHVRHHRPHGVVRHGRGTHGRYRGDRVRAPAVLGGLQLDHDGRWTPAADAASLARDGEWGRPLGVARGASRARRRAPHFGGMDHRPFAWCGWWMRRQVGSDPGPAYNLARNWTRWGHAVAAEIGAIVVWPHHVGLITGRTAGGQWIIKSGNDGHAVRERPRSVAGAIAFRRG